MKMMLGLEAASFLPTRFFVALSFTEQPANKVVAVVAVAFKNCLLFILPSRKKVQVRHAPDTIAGVIIAVILLYHAKLRHGKTTYGCD
jgi:hypothetical protein